MIRLAEERARVIRLDRLRRAVAMPAPISWPPMREPPSKVRPAAVLVPIIEQEDGGLECMFIVRPQTLKHHAGQVAFPGGVIDPEDVDARHAALRETEEELGIARALPEVLGELPPLPTYSGFVVTPVVALLPRDVVLTPSPRETDGVFTVGMGELSDPAMRRTMRSLLMAMFTAWRTFTLSKGACVTFIVT